MELPSEADRIFVTARGELDLVGALSLATGALSLTGAVSVAVGTSAVVEPASLGVPDPSVVPGLDPVPFGSVAFVVIPPPPSLVF